MGISVQWMNSEKDILLVIYDVCWTLDEYYQSVEEIVAHVQMVEHIVDIVHDLREIQGVPTRIMSASSYTEKRLGGGNSIVIIVGLAHPFLKAIVTASRTIAPTVYRSLIHVDDMDQALPELEHRRSLRQFQI